MFNLNDFFILFLSLDHFMYQSWSGLRENGLGLEWERYHVRKCKQKYNKF